MDRDTIITMQLSGSLIGGCLIGLVLLIGFSGCGDKEESPPPPKYAYEAPAFMDLSDTSTHDRFAYRYVKDQYTRKCFVLMTGGMESALAEVPCTSLPKKPQPEE